jgi:hypothetical protein
MVKYPDSNGNKLVKTFYRYPKCNILIYFTGKYEKEGPAFEKESEIGNTRIFPDYIVKQLSQVPKQEIIKRLEESKQGPEEPKQKINWLEEKLKKIKD